MNQISLAEPIEENESRSPLCGALKAGVLWAGAAIAAAAIVNAVIAWNTPIASGRLGGGFNRVPLRHGDAAYFVSGSGSPVLLLHALRPGNSSAEWEENFEALAQNHTVYALDFLGWGLSDKPRHILRSRDYAEQIRHFASDVIGEKCAVIASGEAANFAVAAAEREPQLFSKIALVCPPTFPEDEMEIEVEARGDSAENYPEDHNWHYKVLSLPVVGEAIHNWLTARPQLEAQAKQNLYFDKTHVTSGLVSRLHVAAHQPSVQQALTARAAGLLQSDWRAAWSTLATPALIIWGRNAPEPGIETAPEWLALKPDAKLEVFDEAMLLPHAEHAADFNARLSKWLEA